MAISGPDVAVISVSDRLYQQALILRNNGQFHAAEQLLKQGMARFPADVRFALDFCKVPMNQQDWGEACARFQSLVLHYADVRLYCFWAIALERAGEIQASLECLKAGERQLGFQPELMLEQIRLYCQQFQHTPHDSVRDFLRRVLSDFWYEQLNNIQCKKLLVEERWFRQAEQVIWLLKRMEAISQSSVRLVDISGTGIHQGRFSIVEGNRRLYLPRYAADWTEERHGLTVHRQAILRSGGVLQTLIDHPHPNLGNVLELGDDYVVVEFVEGILLSTQHKYAPKHWTSCYATAPSKQKLDFSALTSVVSHLHQLEIAHTDITLYNMMVDSSGQLRLIDLLSAMPLTAELKCWDLRQLAQCQSQLIQLNLI